jgi:malonyl CoA-acyl carrier protein transacylase
MGEMGVTTFVEVGPGTVLTGLDGKFRSLASQILVAYGQ